MSRKIKPGDKLLVKNYTKVPHTWVERMMKFCGQEITVKSIDYKYNRSFTCVSTDGWIYDSEDFVLEEEELE